MADDTLTPLQQVQELLTACQQLVALVDGAASLLRTSDDVGADRAATLLEVATGKLDDHFASLDQLHYQLQAKEVAHG